MPVPQNLLTVEQPPFLQCLCLLCPVFLKDSTASVVARPGWRLYNSRPESPAYLTHTHKVIHVSSPIRKALRLLHFEISSIGSHLRFQAWAGSRSRRLLQEIVSTTSSCPPVFDKTGMTYSGLPPAVPRPPYQAAPALSV